MKKLLFAIVICFLFITLLPAQAKQDPAAEMKKNLQIVEIAAAVPPRAQSGFNGINAGELMTFMAFLSSDNLEGREAGTRGFDTAAAYGQSLFTLWGLKAGGDMPRPAGGMFRPEPDKPTAKPERGYLQEFPMLEALEATRATVVNRHFMAFVERIIDHVKQGGKFSQPFASYPYTLESVKRMVATGEETGHLPKVMIRLAEFYDAEVERELKNVATLIEPRALIVMGAVVGLIVSSVVLPLFKLAAVMH
jgi:hypothetical protein